MSSLVFLQDSTTVTPVTLTVDPKGYFLYWTDQNKVRPSTPTTRLPTTPLQPVCVGAFGLKSHFNWNLFCFSQDGIQLENEIQTWGPKWNLIKQGHLAGLDSFESRCIQSYHISNNPSQFWNVHIELSLCYGGHDTPVIHSVPPRLCAGTYLIDKCCVRTIIFSLFPGVWFSQCSWSSDEPLQHFFHQQCHLVPFHYSCFSTKLKFL